ncbi:hypothetical protein MIND_00503300 [Mycena indigotica]|uniref:Uncharacterized protein n=1 Tax=Mycena indigotica TaxID=2126181 RepID=A0A8H6SVR6_9AGAR|nr:uncharacterized protein MIND_00503300 [Mycena indigotica]KAF7307100.1 hypothetical protein MIND_00503300 [Mycena indigotica]
MTSVSSSLSPAVASPSSMDSNAPSPSPSGSSGPVVSPSPSSSAPVSSLPPSVSPSAPLSSSLPVQSSSSPIISSSSILTAPSTTVSSSTMVHTSNGQVFTTVVEITSTIPAGSTVVASSHDNVRSSSHTGAIVGGVVGGLAVLGIAAGALLWYRRRSREKTDFDGDFDPARVGRPTSGGPDMIQAGGTLPNLNLDEEDDGMGGRLPHSAIGGGIVTPFTYTPTVSAFDASSRSQSPPMPSGSPPPMSQYSHDGYTPTMSSAGGYYSAAPQQALAPGGYYPPSESGSSAYSPRSAKEREAMGSRSFAVANPTGNEQDSAIQNYLRSGPRGVPQGEHSGGPMASSSAASGVIVHQDGGRVGPDEIPPTYDSIPNDGQRT